MKFKDLAIGQEFDWINPAAPSFNSFYLRCHKTGERTYEDSQLNTHKVGTIHADVFHVGETPKKRFQIYGDYGLESQNLLEDFDLLSEAERWAKGYTRRDLGGYSEVIVLSFKEDGEAVTHWRITSEDE